MIATTISYPAGEPPVSWDINLEDSISWEMYHSIGRHVASWDLEDDQWVTAVNITEEQRELLAHNIEIAFQGGVRVS